ncbi:rCG36833 [Rattus norvegicus]|uniref:RCG36833 n=1 Tax=Rattus norvegicus TaxID=10116 RepID=A6HTN2_RAT|nr:rCG36833 [Rattus norvegicus]
MSERREVTGS